MTTPRTPDVVPTATFTTHYHAPCPQCGRRAVWRARQYSPMPDVFCEPCDAEEGRKHDR